MPPSAHPAALLQALARVERGANGHEHRAGERARRERAANGSRPRSSRRAPRSPGAAPAAGEAPGAGLHTDGRNCVRRLAAAVPRRARAARARRSANPARSIHARYSASEGKSIHVSAIARSSRLPGRTGPITVARPPVPEDAVGLRDAALRVGPVLDRAGRDVAVERVVAERERLRVALELLTPASAGLARARASWCGRLSTIVTSAGSTRATIPSVVKPVPAPQSSVRSPRSSRPAASRATPRIASVQNSGLTQRS